MREQRKEIYTTDGSENRSFWFFVDSRRSIEQQVVQQKIRFAITVRRRETKTAAGESWTASRHTTTILFLFGCGSNLDSSLRRSRGTKDVYIRTCLSVNHRVAAELSGPSEPTQIPVVCPEFWLSKKRKTVFTA